MFLTLEVYFSQPICSALENAKTLYVYFIDNNQKGKIFPKPTLGRS